MQRRVLIIFQAQRLPLHNSFKYIIYKIQNSAARAEIIVKIYVFSPARLKSALPLYKYGRIGVSEAVYALLYIPHIKDVVLLGQAGQDMLLQLIVVLIFIHKYIIISVLQFKSRLRIIQQLSRKPVYIRKIKAARLQFKPEKRV